MGAVRPQDVMTPRTVFRPSRSNAVSNRSASWPCDPAGWGSVRHIAACAA
jgi:hypothetical protein